MRILAVEDEPEYLEMLKLVMKSVGHSIIVASNGIEALKIIEGEKVDVILSDVRMPSMGGIELHQKIREKPEYANTPFIFLTGISDLNAVKAVCEPGRDLLMSKPFPVDQLLKIFSGALK
jgi:two-component system chemotaxis response regulator CheY